MSTKIAKWYLPACALFAVLLLAAGFALQLSGTRLFGYQTALPYSLFAAIPLASAVVGLLLSWLLAATVGKNKAVAEKDAGTAAFFKTHLYLWTLTTIGIALCGVLFTNDYLCNPDQALPDLLIVTGLLWVATVVACAVAWAAFNAWKNSEILGILLGLVACAIFVAADGMGAIYLRHQLRNYDAAPGQYAYDDEDDDSGYAPREEGSSDNTVNYGAAYGFMLNRMQVHNGSFSPVDLLRRWENYGWMEDDYADYENQYDSDEDFQYASASFYHAYSHCAGDSDALRELYRYMRSGAFSLPDQATYDGCGAGALVHALLAAYGDIHATEDPDQTLDDLSAVMEQSADFEQDVVVDFYFPRLRPYISDMVYSDICLKAKADEDSYDAKAVAGWAYSFWARRHAEGTDGIAHTILKMVDNFY